MSGLILKLGPRERVMINGVVLENTERRSRISILTPGASILRMRDAIHPQEVNTPVRRLCYMVQLRMSGDNSASSEPDRLLEALDEIKNILTDADSRLLLSAARHALLEDCPYHALKALRALLPRERRLLNAAAK